jgi:deoxyribose-phosphate aldolase
MYKTRYPVWASRGTFAVKGLNLCFILMNKPIASYIDHTLLKPAITTSDISQLCQEAIVNGFAAVCIPPFLVGDAVAFLSGSEVKTATVIGFPMGYSSQESKLIEISRAIAEGADELDIVINLIALKNKNWNYLEKEMQPLIEVAHGKSKIVKVIVESGILSRDELNHCCELYGAMDIDYMKTSTGYAEKGASVVDVAVMRKLLPDNVKIKASGGIRHYVFARELIEAGADRLGCSSSLQILDEEKNN